MGTICDNYNNIIIIVVSFCSPKLMQFQVSFAIAEDLLTALRAAAAADGCAEKICRSLEVE